MRLFARGASVDPSSILVATDSELIVSHGSGQVRIEHGVHDIEGVFAVGEHVLRDGVREEYFGLVIGATEAVRFDRPFEGKLASTASWRVPLPAGPPIDGAVSFDMDGDGEREIVLVRGSPAVAERRDQSSGELLDTVPVGATRATFVGTLALGHPRAHSLIIGEEDGSINVFLPGSGGVVSYTREMPCVVRDMTIEGRLDEPIIHVFAATDCGLYTLRAVQ